jgi:hypothetical protein
LANFINVNFIIIYVTLQRLSTTWDPKEVIRLFEKFFFPEGSEGESTTGNTVKRLCERTPEYGIKKTIMSLEQASSLVLPMAIGLAVQFGAIDHPGDSIDVIPDLHGHPLHRQRLRA